MSTFKDALLVTGTFPDPTPESAVEQAVSLARLLGVQLSCVASVLDARAVNRYYTHGDWLLDIPALIEESLAKSRSEAARLLACFERAARAQKSFDNAMTLSSIDPIVQFSRLHDLTIFPVRGDSAGPYEPTAEDLVFGAGHPVILLPALEGIESSPMSLERIVVAWDYSITSARALSDAIPLLRKAKDVLLVTFTGEKEIHPHGYGASLSKHLERHGIFPDMIETSVGGKSIGGAMRDYLEAHHANLLVMGAYGHSRVREFILGGATRDIIAKPPIPVFLSR